MSAPIPLIPVPVLTAFPTGGKKFYLSDTEELRSEELNIVSSYLHQLAKDFNINVFQGKQTGYDYPGCIISGCVVTLTSGPTPAVSLGAGVILFSVLATDTTSTKNYSGSLYPIESSTTPEGAIALPSAGNIQTYAIDIRYQETLDGPVKRNLYNTVTQGVVSQTLLTKSINKLTDRYTIILSTESSPKVGYTRLGTFTVTSAGVLSAFNYTLPFIWNLQDWPGSLPHTAGLDKTLTLADSLSAIRAELASILGSSKKWYSAPTADIATTASNITALSASVTGTIPGVKGGFLIGPGSGDFPVPATATRLWVRLWGAGGVGGATVIGVGGRVYSGGGGGGGAYVEEIFSVVGGSNLSYLVGDGISSSPTRIEKIEDDPNSLLWAGQGGDGLSGGAGGAGGTVPVGKTGTLNVNGSAGGDGGYLYNYDNDYILGRYTKFGINIAAGGFAFSPIGAWGHGGFAGEFSGGAGTNGMQGAIVIYWM